MSVYKFSLLYHKLIKNTHKKIKLLVLIFMLFFLLLLNNPLFYRPK